MFPIISNLTATAYNMISLGHMGFSPVRKWSSKGCQILVSMTNEPLFSGYKIIFILWVVIQLKFPHGDKALVRDRLCISLLPSVALRTRCSQKP